MVRVEIPERDRQKSLLSEAATGGVERIPPSLAVDLLAELEISEQERSEALQAVLRNSRTESPVKALVIHSLARLRGSEAVPDILDALRGAPEQDSAVAVAVATALGRVGGAEQVGTVRGLVDSTSHERVRQVARFATNLLAHRHGLADQVVEFPEASLQPRPEATGASVFRSTAAGQFRRRESLDAARHDLPWLSEDQDSYEIQCGRQLLTVLVPRGITGKDGIAQLTARPLVAAVITARKESSGESFASLLVLTHPGKGGVEAMVSRLKGEPFLLGKGTVERDEAVFELDSVQAPGLPAVSVRIRLDRGQLEISGVSSQRKVAGTAPERVAEDEGL